MTRYSTALSLSALLHVLILTAVVMLNLSRPAAQRTLQLKVNLLQKQNITEAPQTRPIQQQNPQEQLRPAQEKVPVHEAKAPTVPEVTKEAIPPLAALRKQPALQQTLVKKTVSPMNRDSLLFVRADQWKQEISALAVQPAEDPGADYLKKISGEPDFNKMGLAQSGKAQPRKPQFNFIPTEDQARAMAYLFEHQHGTQLDMYPSMKTQKPITAVRFDRSMKKLTEKGFVHREKISPENLFVVATPVVAVPIEMSAKNRRNPVFNYTLNVAKKKVLAYLDSRLLKYRERLARFPADSVRTKSRIAIIQSRINIIRQGRF